jgi:putative addiction module killer protein
VIKACGRVTHKLHSECDRGAPVFNAGWEGCSREWLARLKDNQARARILVRINRLSVGNFGDCNPLRDGVSELRVDYGPGYRVYYSNLGRTCVLLLCGLLCGGDKRTQAADINRAANNLRDYEQRNME